MNNDMRKLKSLKYLLLAISTVIVSMQVARASTITFDESPATNDHSSYDGATVLGAEFSPTKANAGTWGGNSNGDPGRWGLEGTNGPQFLGFDGREPSSYSETVTFDTPVSSVSLDFSRANESTDVTIILKAFDGSVFLGSTTVDLGEINTWSTLSVAFPDISKIFWDGTGTGFHPYGADNLTFETAAIPGTRKLRIAAYGPRLSRVGWTAQATPAVDPRIRVLTLIRGPGLPISARCPPRERILEAALQHPWRILGRLSIWHRELRRRRAAAAQGNPIGIQI